MEPRSKASASAENRRRASRSVRSRRPLASTMARSRLLDDRQHVDNAVLPKAKKTQIRTNRLLGAMEAASRERIGVHLEPVHLKLGAVVCEAGGLLKHAYFPQGSVLSLLTVLENGSAIETANIEI